MSQNRLTELASKYALLYVEDENDTRESVLRTLKRVGFANLYSASNGMEGLVVFKEKRPQIVISDIQMPFMNGLDMVGDILEMSPETYVIFTTAFGDNEYFMRSIELKVDKYIMKPIDITRLMESLEDACVKIEQKRLAAAYLAKEAKEKLDMAIKESTQMIVDASPHPTVMFKNGRLSYINDSFLEFLSHKDLSSIDDGVFPDVFEKKSGYLHSFFDYKDDSTNGNKVCIKNSVGKDKIFEVRKKDLLLEGDEITVYFLTDITLLEYQRRKLQLFGNAVQKELISKRFEEIKKTESPTVEKIVHRKISAAEYTPEVDKAIFEQLDELVELEGEMFEDITQFLEKKDGTHLRDFAERLERYAHTMKLLYEFEELSFAIKNIAEVVYQKSADVNPDHAEKIATYCSAIAEDLSNWRRGIFVSADVIDIHYLDDSLYSSCLQLEFEFKGVKLEDEGSDLELF